MIRLIIIILFFVSPCFAQDAQYRYLENGNSNQPIVIPENVTMVAIGKTWTYTGDGTAIDMQPGSRLLGGKFNCTTGNGVLTRNGCELVGTIINCSMLDATYPLKAYGSTEVRSCEFRGGKASGMSFRLGESLVEYCSVTGYYHHGLGVYEPATVAVDNCHFVGHTDTPGGSTFRNYGNLVVTNTRCFGAGGLLKATNNHSTLLQNVYARHTRAVPKISSVGSGSSKFVDCDLQGGVWAGDSLEFHGCTFEGNTALVQPRGTTRKLEFINCNFGQRSGWLFYPVTSNPFAGEAIIRNCTNIPAILNKPDATTTQIRFQGKNAWQN